MVNMSKNFIKMAIAPFFYALAAFYLAVGLGIPVWRDWIPGDATDIATLVFFATLIAMRKE